MAVKPNPFYIYCSICKWPISSAPASDVLTPFDLPSECPKCGNDDLKIKPSNNPLTNLLGKLFG